MADWAGTPGEVRPVLRLTEARSGARVCDPQRRCLLKGPAAWRGNSRREGAGQCKMLNEIGAEVGQWARAPLIIED